MFHKILLKEWLPSHILECGWYLDCPKNNTPSSKIPLKENLELALMENLANFARTQVEGGKRKILYKREN